MCTVHCNTVVQDVVTTLIQVKLYCMRHCVLWDTFNTSTNCTEYIVCLAASPVSIFSLLINVQLVKIVFYAILYRGTGRHTSLIHIPYYRNRYRKRYSGTYIICNV